MDGFFFGRKQMTRKFIEGNKYTLYLKKETTIQIYYLIYQIITFNVLSIARIVSMQCTDTALCFIRLFH